MNKFNIGDKVTFRDPQSEKGYRSGVITDLPGHNEFYPHTYQIRYDDSHGYGLFFPEECTNLERSKDSILTETKAIVNMIDEHIWYSGSDVDGPVSRAKHGAVIATLVQILVGKNVLTAEEVMQILESK